MISGERREMSAQKEEQPVPTFVNRAAIGGPVSVRPLTAPISQPLEASEDAKGG